MNKVIEIGGHQLRFMQCGTCGVWHAFPETIYDHARREGGFWWCPNGHQRGWKNGTDQEELTVTQRERDRLKQDAARLEEEIAAQKQLVAATEKRLQQAKRRAVSGVCPCCNRTFENVQRHMKSRHPNVVPMAQKNA